MGKKLSEEEVAARRERQRMYNQAYYRARLANDLCVRCGKNLPVRERWRGHCRPCREARQREDRKRAIHKREREEEALRAALEACGTPVCPRCGGTHIERLRRPREGRTFRCKDCLRAHRQTVAPRPGRNPYPCPYCQGRCKKGGFGHTGKQQFVCRECRRSNTLLRAHPKPPGPLRHQFVLVLGIASHRKLVSYCAARGMKEVTAIREICRKYAYPVTGCTTIRHYTDAWGEPASVIERPPRVTLPLRFTEATLPDARPADMRARRSEQRAEQLLYLPRPVGVVRSVPVRLDDEAWEGLHRMMAVLKKNHQETARWMILQERV